MARRPLIAGNWKMNTTYAEAVSLAQKIVNEETRAWDPVDVVLIPPFVSLRGVSNVIAFDDSRLLVGAQDVSPFDDGAVTGEISVRMITDLDCKYGLVGHSERRGIIGETDTLVNQKLHALLAGGLTPILCVGEPADVHEAGETIPYVTAQVRTGLEGVPAGRMDEVVIAYEPIWAIGTGAVATPDHAAEVARAIRGTVAELSNEVVTEELRILYGGSVKPGNATLFVEAEGIDGMLIGGASLDANAFVAIIDSVLEAQ